MALNHNIIPQTSLVFGVRDFAPQIDAIQKGDTQGLQNAFKFGTQVYDYMQGRKQANLIDDFNKARQENKDLDMQDAARLEELERELATLKGGV